MELDLVYTDARHVPRGILSGYALDLSFGGDENRFELVCPANTRLDPGALVGAYGTEYGGIVDETEPADDGYTITYMGRTWHGLLVERIIEPDAGAGHLHWQGEAHAMIRMLVSRCGLSSLFEVPGSSGITIPSLDFDRYTTVWDGMTKALSKAGARPSISWDGGRVVIKAVKAKTVEVDSDTHPVHIVSVHRSVNHLICLGKGELADRTVIHLYTDAAGSISTSPTFTGVDEIAEVYDYSNAEAEELEKKGREELAKRHKASSAELSSLDDLGDIAAVGDTFHAIERTTGIEARATVTKKIVKVRYDGTVEVRYETGEKRATGDAE